MQDLEIDIVGCYDSAEQAFGSGVEDACLLIADLALRRSLRHQMTAVDALSGWSEILIADQQGLDLSLL